MDKVTSIVIQVAVFIMIGNQSPQLNLETCLGIYDIGLDSNCSIL
jgi:hypothetical protein